LKLRERERERDKDLPKRFKFKVEDFNLFAANEREVIAVLRLVYRTTRNFPGVFYHGKASAVLPVVGRVLPFFARNLPFD
jgi:hypothetical protein